MSPGARLDVWTAGDGRNGETIWKIGGSATVNADGSLEVRLDVLPLDGRLHIRPPSAAQAAKESSNG